MAQKNAWSPNKFLEIYQNALDSHERDHPHWQVEVLVSLIKWGLKNLKHNIEEVRGSRITWHNPFLELHYPVEWNWDSRPISTNPDVVHSGLALGTLTKQNIANKRAAVKTLTQMMVRRLNTLALDNLTNGAWFEVKNNYCVPILPFATSERLRAVRGERKRREAFQELVRPFSIGAATIDYSGMKLTDNAPVPKHVKKQLARIGDLIDIKKIAMTEEVNGRRIELSLIFQIAPLIADYDQKKAYHPITVGLFIEPRVVENNIITTTPAEWPRADRQILWRQILQEVDTLTSQLIPKQEVQASIILLVNDGLEIRRAINDPKQIETAKRWITDLDNADQRRSSESANLPRLIQAVDRASASDEKGRALEELASQLFCGIPGFALDGKRVKTQTEEIDLVISNASEDPKLRREDAIILVECKNWSSKCGKNEFVEFRGKMENRKRRCSLGFLISWNGFADTVTKEMLRGSHERLLVVPIDGKQIRESVNQGSFQDALMSAWDAATMT
jgi:hypothetical protein